ncbi:MFS transporter [Pantoea rwandensis]|uniref:MFS transporter n=1 Tax=Pantoea rwandensis TaxID=1076550 RepID=A0A1X1D611_9GAMM|nr:MFS transporter [Pantoea rwandensis]ORM72098.1 MFS transporter [Pantoea rwandensis]
MSISINSYQEQPKATKKEFAAVVLGAAVEFFDFSAYAIFAVMIGNTFFPSANAFTSLLLSVSVFAIGFIVRPLGAIFIGSYADRAGRKPAMLLTMVLMTIGTGGLVILPGYETIGIAAPILLVIVRMMQGLAWGGEAGPSTTYIMEAAPEGRKAYYISYQIVAQGIAGIMAGTIGFLLTNLLTSEQMSVWGWRIPFAIGLIILPIAIYMRRNLNETFQNPQDSRDPTTRSLLSEVFKNYRGLVITCVFLISGNAITMYFLNYMTTYALKELKFSPSIAMETSILIGVIIIIFSLLGGYLADRFGRKMPILVPRILLTILIVPGLEIVNKFNSESVFFAVISVLAILQGLSGAGVVTVLCENFPKYIRSTGFSIAYAFGITIFGGTAQIVFSWLIELTGNPSSPGYYLMAANILGLTALILLKERNSSNSEHNIVAYEK